MCVLDGEVCAVKVTELRCRAVSDLVVSSVGRRGVTVRSINVGGSGEGGEGGDGERDGRGVPALAIASCINAASWESIRALDCSPVMLLSCFGGVANLGRMINLRS